MATFDGALPNCPFPEVAEALRPYIRTRQEALQVRKTLQATLPLLSVNAGNPGLDIGEEPSGVGGVRKAYWKALRAHQAAQAKYDDLKTELQQMVQQGDSASRPAADSNTFLTEAHIPLLRQREKLRQVRAIESTAAKIKNTGGEVIGESFDKVARREVGELPTPPTQSSLADRDLGFSSEYDLVQLKKAVLSTKQQLGGHEQIIAEIKGVRLQNIDPHADLRALQKAHNVLTSWMETQLAVISKAEGSKDSDTASTASPQPEENGTATSAMAEIEDIYELYIGARKRLLETVTTTPSPEQNVRSMIDTPRRGSDIAESELRATPSETVLPYLSKILSSKQIEQTLLQQSAFTRRQMASAEAQTNTVLVRLADESHLVQPSLTRASPQGQDWAKAAAEAGAATAKAATQRAQAGKNFAEVAFKALGAIKTMPESVDVMLD